MKIPRNKKIRNGYYWVFSPPLGKKPTVKFFLCCRTGMFRTRKNRQWAEGQWASGSLLTPCCNPLPQEDLGSCTWPSTKLPGPSGYLRSTFWLWPSPAARGNLTQPHLSSALQARLRMLVQAQRENGCPACPSTHSGGSLQVVSM